MSYRHTQHSPLGYILFSLSTTLAIGLGVWYRDRPEAFVPVLVAGVALTLAALSFGHLTVADEGEHLALRYGPLPLFRKRIPYTAITGVEPDRSSVIDGWGIHYIPWRGWTYNLWGFDCVRLQLGSRIIRIGSDDVDNLVEFLRARIGRQIEPARP